STGSSYASTSSTTSSSKTSTTSSISSTSSTSSTGAEAFATVFSLSLLSLSSFFFAFRSFADNSLALISRSALNLFSSFNSSIEDLYSVPIVAIASSSLIVNDPSFAFASIPILPVVSNNPAASKLITDFFIIYLFFTKV